MVEVSWWDAPWGRVVNKFIDVYHEDVEARTRGNGSVSWLRLWVWLWPPLIVIWIFLQGVASAFLEALQCHEFFMYS